MDKKLIAEFVWVYESAGEVPVQTGSYCFFRALGQIHAGASLAGKDWREASSTTSSLLLVGSTGFASVREFGG